MFQQDAIKQNDLSVFNLQEKKSGNREVYVGAVDEKVYLAMRNLLGEILANLMTFGTEPDSAVPLMYYSIYPLIHFVLIDFSVDTFLIYNYLRIFI